MILLLLGTNPYPFTRLLSAVNKWAVETSSDVVAQTGHTPAVDLYIKCYDFIDHAKIQELIKKSEFVITQGGFGSIKDCLENNKITIVAPRYQELHECQDSQLELVNALAAEERIVPLYDVDKIDEVISKAKEFKSKMKTDSAIPHLVASLVDSYMDAY